MVPKAQDAITQRLEERGTIRIVVSPRRVLAPVELHDQIPLAAAEVDDVGADRYLTRELGAEETTISQTGPEAALCIGLPPPQTAREVSWGFAHNTQLDLAPHPALSPEGRGCEGEGGCVGR